MPGKGAAAPEGVGHSTNDVLRIINVSKPTMTIYPAPASKTAEKAAPAMVVCPGGGYGLLAYDKEGVEIATWLNSLGITGVVLKYRVPGNRDGALCDLERTIRLLRANAGEWKIHPAKIGVIGFSAGGHLCARLSTNSGKAFYADIDAVDTQSIRPDFALLIYPGFMADASGKPAPELPITPAVPPLFIAQAEDDKLVAGTKIFYAGLREAKLPVEAYFVAKGGHGHGLRGSGPLAEWPQRAVEWLKKNGVL
ncbi:alpha/beta hydrolase [Prosthecobacter sp.]|uniref:alpha/beta hydrolase n=1 Tax=Prosthecobacter sp. TaxID=1965333 RepID=UPI003784902C